MRDVGILIWVVLLIVGVCGSMISSIRRQMQSAQTPGPSPQRAQAAAPPQPPGGAPVPQPPQWVQRVLAQTQQPSVPPRTAPRPQTPSKPRAQAAPVRQTQPIDSHAPHAIPSDTIGSRLFANKRSLVRAVIAAEVLGKPRAFNDEYTRY
jgi:hypothetical protein